MISLSGFFVDGAETDYGTFWTFGDAASNTLSSIPEKTARLLDRQP
jgi:hypothetical protein